MPREFVFLREYQVDKEKVWEYFCSFLFNRQEVKTITITDYWLTRPGREMITKELICKLVARLNGKRLWPTNYSGSRQPFIFETTHQNKHYRLYFWFKDGTTDHLWIRNCHRID